jgi:hypothetical protein
MVVLIAVALAVVVLVDILVMVELVVEEQQVLVLGKEEDLVVVATRLQV